MRLVAVVATVAIVLAACGSSKSNGSGNSGGATTTKAPKIVDGGTLTVGAEQEPDCFDWIDACGGSSWGSWMGQYQTVPRAFDPIPQGGGVLKNEPGVLLTGMPTFSATPVETITYHINPKAVWSDGVPITCDDFKYTADQIANGANIYDRTGYTDIAKVDCTDESSPVVTYKPGTAFSGWQALFAGGTGVLPSHILQGKDRDALMKNGYDWSGGPWIAKWTKGDNITLTPNTKYWGDQPHLAKVVFKFEADTAAEFQAFKSNQVQAIYPQPQIDVVDAIGSGIANANTATNANTAYVEALWLNNGKAPFDDEKVREALGYAIDRDAVVKQLFGKLGVDHAVNSINPFAIEDYSDQDAFAGYHLDLSKVNDLMTGDGWAKQGGIWTKNGQKAEFTLSTTSGNKRRQLTAQVVQSELQTAGFTMHINLRDAGDLFGEDLPKGNYQASLYASGLTALTPGLCSQFCSKNIPGPANQNSGQNWTRTNVKELDTQLEIVDTNPDAAAEKAAGKKGDEIMATNAVTFPLDPLPDILIWSKKVVGPVQDNSILGMFWNINEWGCAGGVC
ncbi:MAG TPA: ABC transporter substrate-binding protein [Acidimicrobiia bacterium]|jgi:peptide/nickel transport system substrate-binding protein|nr:ABC transporter substrate-binding protein [Acidimicrobiia bacterium]